MKKSMETKIINYLSFNSNPNNTTKLYNQYLVNATREEKNLETSEEINNE